ncbi:GerAB/ArcD/ProY family transporter [Gracilibacillus oryzae]|uniref:GerAB/ArcD/ProY family transporter n=1 Tax=Gracilibacillus oryzae TaxID=1672701 RepID=A0A7C8GSK0_9BACI|nr:GerAB/ArcD/ProY family transporter [Gracilibacillus oryzae]KAB8131766.1 GerAB/ArcD/ProY family transporter [Gracilibacillus oryzae]
MNTQQQKPDISQMVSPFLIFFILFSSQMGEGILSFGRKITKIAGYDSWISVLITGFLVTLVIIVIWRLIPPHEDLIDIHQTLFGKIIGNLLSFLFGIYLLVISMFVLRSYVEIIQVWFFPDLSLLWFYFIIYLLIVYIVLGGFRIIVGFAFFSAWIPLSLLFTVYTPFKTGHIENLLPILSTDYLNIIKAVEPIVSSFLGVELILLFAPFIRQFHKSRKWAISANIYTTLLYLLIIIADFFYFSENQIQQLTWPALHVWKIVSLPFIERFEYVGISLHFGSIIATTGLYFWGSVQSFHRLTKFSFRGISIISAISGVACMFVLSDYLIVEKLSALLTKAGMYLLFLYIPFLYICHIIHTGVKKRLES